MRVNLVWVLLALLWSSTILADTSPCTGEEGLSDCAVDTGEFTWKLPGEFTEDGTYIPSDPQVFKLRNSGDLKSFVDVSLRGFGGATGLAYELTDGHVKVGGWRVPMTLDFGLSTRAVGLHLGWKWIPVIDLGPFLGFKYNFNQDQRDTTLGFQLIKLVF